MCTSWPVLLQDSLMSDLAYNMRSLLIKCRRMYIANYLCFVVAGVTPLSWYYYVLDFPTSPWIPVWLYNESEVKTVLHYQWLRQQIASTIPPLCIKIMRTLLWYRVCVSWALLLTIVVLSVYVLSSPFPSLGSLWHTPSFPSPSLPPPLSLPSLPLDRRGTLLQGVLLLHPIRHHLHSECDFGGPRGISVFFSLCHHHGQWNGSLC